MTPRPSFAFLLLVPIVLNGPSSASAQSGFSVEVSGGVGLPGFGDWAAPRLVGPAASLGVAGDFSDTWGWVISAQYNQFAYRKERGETTNQFESEPPGEVIVVTTSDLEGGLYSLASVILGTRIEVSQSRTSRSYLTFGVVLGSTSQNEATVEQTVAVNGEVTESGRSPWIGEYSDLAVGVTAGIGVARRFNETLDWFAEFGYQAAVTPDDSVPDNPDFLSAKIGIRVRI